MRAPIAHAAQIYDQLDRYADIRPEHQADVLAILESAVEQARDDQHDDVLEWLREYREQLAAQPLFTIPTWLSKAWDRLFRRNRTAQEPPDDPDGPSAGNNDGTAV